MNSHTMAHRWCNQDFGRNNGFTAKSTHCTKWDYYSYNTIIAQWLDMERKIMVVFDRNISSSKTTNNHRADIYNGATGDTTVFPYADGGGYYSWNGAELCKWGGHFDYNERVKLLEYYLHNMYDAYVAINEESKLTSLNFNDYWEYVDKLCQLYKDITLKKWIRKPGALKSKLNKKQLTEMRKMVKLHIEGVTEISSIIDGMFGDGSWTAFEKRTEPLRKAQRVREFVAKVNEHVGYDVRLTYSKDLPYRKISQIKADGARMILLRKFNRLWHKENDKKFKNNRKKAIRNAIKFLGIQDISSYNMPDSYNCLNYNVEVKHVSVNGESIYKYKWCSGEYDIPYHLSLPTLVFDYSEFRRFPDAKRYKENFIKKATILGRLDMGKNLYIKVHQNQLSEDELNDEQVHLYNEFAAWLDKAQKRKKRAEKVEKDRKARLAEERAAKLDSYKAHGIDGVRQMWRERLCSIYEYDDLPDFYSGGNVLLRWSKAHNCIETSKHIKLSIAQCKRYWKIISLWHENPSKFEPVQMQTESGTYTVISYENDVLTAGCHKISYYEMKRMMQEILGNEA